MKFKKDEHNKALRVLTFKDPDNGSLTIESFRGDPYFGAPFGVKTEGDGVNMSEMQALNLARALLDELARGR